LLLNSDEPIITWKSPDWYWVPKQIKGDSTYLGKFVVSESERDILDGTLMLLEVVFNGLGSDCWEWPLIIDTCLDWDCSELPPTEDLRIGWDMWYSIQRLMSNILFTSLDWGINCGILRLILDMDCPRFF